MEGIKGGLEPLMVVLEQESYQNYNKKAFYHEEKSNFYAWLEKNGSSVFLATSKVFHHISDTVKSQGILAVFAYPELQVRGFLNDLNATFLILDQVRDPGNMGTFIRHAAAFDCKGVFLLKGCCDPYSPKAVRASMGGIYSMPLEQECDASELLEVIQKEKIWLYVLDQNAASLSALEIDFAPKAAFVIGGETHGIGDYWDETKILRVAIPQTSRVDSLNAAVAASIILSKRYQSKLKV